MRRAALGLALVVLTAGCAKYPVVRQPPARADLYVLLADARGTVGTLIVTSEGREHALNTANAAVRIPQPGVIETVATTDAERRSIFGPALAALPPRPTSYVLNFLLDSDELTPESRAVVAQILGEITSRPAPEILVIGHTDTMGTDEHNDRLSLQRAERVRTLLVERGLATKDIETSGRGKRELLFPTADQVEEPRNRRVEIVVK
jgi:outer membrane protein OmpA-like peptidoglycan-associated protein